MPTTHEGVDGLIAMDDFDDIEIVFDATSAGAHTSNDGRCAPYGKRLIDLTPAAIGPYVVPAVNLRRHLDAANVNMVTCGGQATIPIVYAVSRVDRRCRTPRSSPRSPSKSAGPGTRANIDEFTETTAEAIEAVGGAWRGKAIIILNPGRAAADHARHGVHADRRPRTRMNAGRDPPVDHRRWSPTSAAYVPGYRLKQEVQFTRIPEGEPVAHAARQGRWARCRSRHKVSVFLEVEGAAHYLPAYAGNLDIMTSAGLQIAERHRPAEGSQPK